MATHVENLEREADRPSTASSWPTEQNIADFMAITEEVFGGARFELEKDPDSGEICHVARVSAPGDDDQVDAFSNKWHSRIVDELPNCVGRLVLDVRFR